MNKLVIRVLLSAFALSLMLKSLSRNETCQNSSTCSAHVILTQHLCGPCEAKLRWHLQAINDSIDLPLYIYIVHNEGRDSKLRLNAYMSLYSFADSIVQVIENESLLLVGLDADFEFDTLVGQPGPVFLFFGKEHVIRAGKDILDHQSLTVNVFSLVDSLCMKN